jgi:DNA-binding transcriptional regulator YdaS (Cro superfamily)
MSEITPAERKKLAELIGVNEQYLYQCLTGRREMDPGAAMRAEIATSGELKRQMLCQKTYSAIWPELAPAASTTAHLDADTSPSDDSARASSTAEGEPAPVAFTSLPYGVQRRAVAGEG